mmetsp:Transcript_95346/g.208543  ORF Transcript_95346/g.208543 Transcript_95346/m.208543 type:complete len:374 (-) Transcript_95346:191-1312(-)|eukprot:CAMPEP_0206604214 /NCGR_PEP_ID=MMETSP0325_2-20121206/49141_1 /ASSEMBLY_ACC=CAM_ASM_000347 /TAXON_ID=2866 /ORGANISM="Crypthecodinium cohnii, Strain Seligo" /LENGTH=373 /DNA_ID=CAMNT_0054118433 /DNA_START=31 /DNA_END=1152 /DNA_ORIENTATION=+
MDSFNAIALRGICSIYFESHVSPLLSSMRDLQSQMDRTIQELKATVENKADKADVTSTKDIERLEQRMKDLDSGGGGGAHGGISTRVKLQDLQTALGKKADINEVPTMSYMNKALAAAESKAIAREAALTAQVSELKALIKRSGLSTIDNESLDRSLETASSVASLTGVMPPSPSKDTVISQQELPSLQLQVLEDRIAALEKAYTMTPTPSVSQDKADFKKIQVIVAAAGMRFEKQIREMKRQMEGMKSEMSGTCTNNSAAAGPRGSEDEFGSRWPGRVLPAGTGESGGHNQDGGMDHEVASVAAESDVGSAMGSVYSVGTGLNPEEKAELKRIQTIIGVAGTAFTRELREVRGAVRIVAGEVQALKSKMSTA